jgi:hypothetical protein
MKQFQMFLLDKHTRAIVRILDTIGFDSLI